MNNKRQPKQFKTQREVWAFLMEKEGNSVIDKRDREILFFKDGTLVDNNGHRQNYSFLYFEYWQEHIEEKWEDKLDGTADNDNGVWCWYGDSLEQVNKKMYVGLAVDFCSSGYTVDNGIRQWICAKKLTPEDFEKMIAKNEKC